MQHVKLFEQFINEIINVWSGYPYRKVYSTESREDETLLGEIRFMFKTDHGTVYFVDLIEEPFSYIYSFRPNNGTYGETTDEHDAIRVLATATRILMDLIQGYDLRPIPILIKGAPKPQDEILQDETKRDRIYKNIARREIDKIKPWDLNVKGYKFTDHGKNGLVLDPIYDDIPEEK